jgi:hypothetical protein
MTWVLEKTKPLQTLKHALSYGTMERDTQAGVGGGGEPGTDSPGDPDEVNCEISEIILAKLICVCRIRGEWTDEYSNPARKGGFC